MPNMFAGYGESLEPKSCWCEEISLQEIEERALEQLENFKNPDKLFLSHDLYADLMKQFGHTYTPLGPKAPMQLLKIMTSAGQLDVIQVPGLCNFCLVGTEDDYNLVERTKIDKAFEEIVFDGKDNAYWGSTPEDNKLSGSIEVSTVAKPINSGS
jgi:hypothetical protein